MAGRGRSGAAEAVNPGSVGDDGQSRVGSTNGSARQSLRHSFITAALETGVAPASFRAHV